MATSTSLAMEMTPAKEWFLCRSQLVASMEMEEEMAKMMGRQLEEEMALGRLNIG